MINLALFGAGRIGTVHGLNAAAIEDVNVSLLVEPIESDMRTRLAAKLGAELVSAEAVFADPTIDGVIIASSTDSHPELLEQAAAAGKAVFCEKPVSLDFARTQSVVERVEAANIPCLLGFQRRYDPNFRAVRERIFSGEAGRLQQLVMTTRDPSPPPVEYVRRSGGMMRDQAIHDFDMARYLLDEEITSCYAVGSCLIDPAIGEAGDIDSALVTLTTRSGRQVQMINARRAPFGYDQRLEALCEQEALWVNNSLASTVSIGSVQGFTQAPPENYFIERFAAAYRAEMEAFTDLIQHGTSPLAGIRDGLEAQRLAEAAMVSLQSGQPVELSLNWVPPTT